MGYLANKAGQSTVTVGTESGTTKTLELSDSGQYIRLTNAGAKVITVPPQASVAWEEGTVITIRNASTGDLTFAEGAGVTIVPDDLEIEENGTTQLIRISEDNWDLI